MSGGITKLATEQGIIAALQNNELLIDWVHAQPLCVPLTRGWGLEHHGQFACAAERREVLDWYHLKENLYKVEGSLQRLVQAEALLWRGDVEQTMTLFAELESKQARNFCQYLRKHRHRIINYAYYQAEEI